MDRDRSDAVRRRITETHRRQRRAEIDALKDELSNLRGIAASLLNRAAVLAVRLKAVEGQHDQEETTIALPTLPPYGKPRE